MTHTIIRFMVLFLLGGSVLSETVFGLSKNTTGYISPDFYQQVRQLEVYSPNMKLWGPWNENYYVHLSPADRITWGPWYTKSLKPFFVKQKTQHTNLQNLQGRVLLPMNPVDVYEARFQDFTQEQYTEVK